MHTRILILCLSTLFFSACLEDEGGSTENRSSSAEVTTRSSSSMDTPADPEPAPVLQHDNTWGIAIPYSDLPKACQALYDTLFTRDSAEFPRLWQGGAKGAIFAYNTSEYPVSSMGCCDSLGGREANWDQHPYMGYLLTCDLSSDDGGSSCNPESGCRYGCELSSAVSACTPISTDTTYFSSTNLYICPTLAPGTCRNTPTHPHSVNQDDGHIDTYEMHGDTLIWKSQWNLVS